MPTSDAAPHAPGEIGALLHDTDPDDEHESRGCTGSHISSVPPPPPPSCEGTSARPRVLVFLGHYFPAKRLGGPARSVAALAEAIPNVDFFIFTSETEFKDSGPLPGILPDAWIGRGTAHVFYASPRERRLWSIRRHIHEIRPDIICLNSYFARRFTLPVLLLRRFSLLPKTRVIVAPRGEFSPGALGLKSLRKKIYRILAHASGLYRNVVWHATSPDEARDIRRAQGANARIVLAHNLPPPPVPEAPSKHRKKETGECHLLFLSRISPMKNLDGALEILSRVSTPVRFDIYGPREDPDYWTLCQTLIARLPAHIRVDYRGAVDPDETASVMGEYDALFLPTHGENYGYAIVEAWAAATPVLISDRTPWKPLSSETGGGAFPLEDPGAFVSFIERLARTNEEEHARWRLGAWHRAQELFRSPDLLEGYTTLFGQADTTAPPRADRCP